LTLTENLTLPDIGLTVISMSDMNYPYITGLNLKSHESVFESNCP